MPTIRPHNRRHARPTSVCDPVKDRERWPDQSSAPANRAARTSYAAVAAAKQAAAGREPDAGRPSTIDAQSCGSDPQPRTSLRRWSRPTTMAVMLDGTSSERSVLGRSIDGSAERIGDHVAPASVTEPRPEIWYRRKVRLIPAARELWVFRELIFTLAERDLRVRYKQAVLGIAWAVITPVVMMVLFTVVLNRFTKVNTNGAPYALFSYLGLLPWTFFSGALSSGGLSLVSNVALLNKLYCPREVFPIAAIADAAVDALIATLVLALLFPITGFAPKAQVFYLPLLLVVLVMFTIGVTVAVSSIVVYMRDLRLVLPVVIQLGLFATPVLYTPQSIFKSELLLVAYSVVNPLVPVIDGIRRTILQGKPPEWLPLGAGAASALVLMLAGFWLFKKMETGIADVA